MLRYDLIQYHTVQLGSYDMTKCKYEKINSTHTGIELRYKSDSTRSKRTRSTAVTAWAETRFPSNIAWLVHLPCQSLLWLPVQKRRTVGS